MQNYYNGDYDAAQAIFEEALTIYRSQQHEAETGQTLCNLGRVLFQQQKFPEAGQCFTQALAKAQERGDQRLSGQTLYFLGRLAYYRTDYQKAKSLLEESLHINRTIGTRAAEIAFPLVYLGAIARDNDDMQTAKELSNDALVLTYQEQHIYSISLILPFHASLALIEGEHARAVQLVAAGQSLYRNLGIYLPPNDQLAFDQPLATARQLLPSIQFTEAWANGELMTVDEAVSLALGPLFI
jgi:tetratricopeptide (TPR) repeat protein